MATKTKVSMRLEVGDRLAEPKGGFRIRMARGESESVEVSAELLDGGRPFDAAGLSARFMAVLAGGRHVAMPVPPEGVSGGTLTYTLPSGLGATPGDTRLAVFELSDGEGYRIYTEPFTVSVADGPSPTSAEIGPYIPELDALIAQLKAAIGSAGDATGTASSAAAKAEAAAAEADDAAAKAEAAIAEVKATEAKLYPAAENVLVGSETGTVAHVEDAFNGATLRGITVEGACKQVTTTGKNLCAGFEHGQIDVGGAETGNETTKSCRTGFIAVEGGASYVLSLVGVSASTTAKGCQYDSSKAYIGSLALYAGKAAATSESCAYLRYEFDESVSGDAAKLVEGTAHAQIEKGSSATAYEPYTGGKPSPSPEYPQGITVIEHPTVNALGRNILSGSRLAEILPEYYAADSGKVKALNSCNISWLTVPSYGTLPAGTYWVSGDVSLEIRRASDNSGLRYGNGAFKLGSDTEVKIKALTGRSKYPVTAEIQLELGAAPTAYAPYTEQQIAFNLPEEHPYLAKLPDGTADTIEVDEDGNVELVARVAKAVLDGSLNFRYYKFGDNKAYFETVSPIGSGTVDVGQWGGMFDRFETANPYSYGSRICAYSFANTNGTLFRIRPSETFADATAFTDWLSSNPVTSYYADTEPKKYSLGKIEMPKAQDSIVNVWADAEVTPSTSIEYVRDVNIVVANLESAIASIS